MHVCVCECIMYPPLPLSLQLSSALLFDAVYAVVAAVQELNRSQNVGATQLSCKSSKIWEHGTSLMNYLRMVRLPQMVLMKIVGTTDHRLPQSKFDIMGNTVIYFLRASIPLT